ncbi:MAG: cytochrome P450, partial [Thermomicrobiales bacterium]|nr:cytochrome P450 [Thermomicrobiales bacterium]
MNRPDQDWDPRSTVVQHDQRAAYDAMRARCPVAWSDDQGWSVFRHDDVVRALMDPDTFSNRVSKRPAVPNGMDPPEHTAYRAVIVPYFSEARMQTFEPVGRGIAADLATEARKRSNVEAMSEFALVAAVRFQTAFLGWPAETREFLIDWIDRSNRATHAKDRAAQAAVAQDFE